MEYGRYGDSRQSNDTGPLHVEAYRRHASALVSCPIIGQAPADFSPPSDWEAARFLRVVPLGGAVTIEIGLVSHGPGVAKPTAGSLYVPDGAIEYLQLPRPVPGSGDKPLVRLSGVGGAVNVQATWLK